MNHFSDANLKRYFIRPSSIASAMTQDPNVSVFIIFIGSLGDEAIQLVFMFLLLILTKMIFSNIISYPRVLVLTNS